LFFRYGKTKYTRQVVGKSLESPETFVEIPHKLVLKSFFICEVTLHNENCSKVNILGRMNKNGAFAWEHEQGAKANCGLSKSICSTLNE
jgi:hypothetical protein